MASKLPVGGMSEKLFTLIWCIMLRIQVNFVIFPSILQRKFPVQFLPIFSSGSLVGVSGVGSIHGFVRVCLFCCLLSKSCCSFSNAWASLFVFSYQLNRVIVSSGQNCKKVPLYAFLFLSMGENQSARFIFFKIFPGYWLISLF